MAQAVLLGPNQKGLAGIDRDLSTAAPVAIGTNPAFTRGIPAPDPWTDSLVVVQAVAGSSPVAHPQTGRGKSCSQ